MKKILFLIAVLFSVVFAAAPGAYTDAIGIYGGEQKDTVADAYDTLVDATDSSVLFNNFEPESGVEYILERKAYSGGSTDSVKVEVIMRPLTWEGVAICSVAVDSFVLAGGEAVLIPFDQFPASMYDIVLRTYTAMGHQLIINYHRLMYRVPMWVPGKYRQ